MTKYPADVDQPKITKLKEGSTCIVHGSALSPFRRPSSKSHKSSPH